MSPPLLVANTLEFRWSDNTFNTKRAAGAPVEEDPALNASKLTP